MNTAPCIKSCTLARYRISLSHAKAINSNCYDRTALYEVKRRQNSPFCQINCSLRFQQWRHQGGAWRANAPQLEALPPTCPPVRRKKWQKSAIFGKILDFCPLRIAFFPLDAPHKKIRVPPLDFKVCECETTMPIKMHLIGCELSKQVEDFFVRMIEI